MQASQTFAAAAAAGQMIICRGYSCPSLCFHRTVDTVCENARICRRDEMKSKSASTIIIIIIIGSSTTTTYPAVRAIACSCLCTSSDTASSLILLLLLANLID